MTGWIRTCWEPFFNEKRLSEISKADLKAFSLWLVDARKLKSIARWDAGIRTTEPVRRALDP